MAVYKEEQFQSIRREINLIPLKFNFDVFAFLLSPISKEDDKCLIDWIVKMLKIRLTISILEINQTGCFSVFHQSISHF